MINYLAFRIVICHIVILISRMVDCRFLASIETIHTSNLYTDIIFFCCQVKYILFLTTAKSTLNHVYITL
jgi:hypothetical protein